MLISNEWANRMKRCSKCGETKPYMEFHKYKRGDGYQPWCKTCRKEYDHDYNLRNHRRWADQKLAWQQSRGAWLREMKTGKTCTDCGGSFPLRPWNGITSPALSSSARSATRSGHGVVNSSSKNSPSANSSARTVMRSELTEDSARRRPGCSSVGRVRALGARGSAVRA